MTPLTTTLAIVGAQSAERALIASRVFSALCGHL